MVIKEGGLYRRLMESFAALRSFEHLLIVLRVVTLVSTA